MKNENIKNEFNKLFSEENMRRTKGFSALLFLAVAMFLGCNDTANTNTANNRVTNTNTMSNTNSMTNHNSMTNTNSLSNANSNTAVVQSNFWLDAARGGLAEVELSRLAATKAQNAEVKQFAQMMITDHTKANAELKTLAAKKNAVIPTDLDSNHKDTLEDLRGLTGAEFDRAYVEAMVDDHESSVELFEDMAEDDDAENADAKAFAAKTLPTLKKHLEMIKNIQTKLK
jgi:putative membrane protein